MAILNPWPNIKDNEINDNTTWSSNKINAAFEFIKDQEITIEKTGNVVNFKNCNTDPFIDVLCDINPTQTGSGDPSPDNVRPIPGYSTINVHNGDIVYPDVLGQTVYKGSLNVTTGELIETYKAIDLGDNSLGWYYNSTYNIFMSAVFSDIKKPTSSTIPDWLCEIFKIESASHVYNSSSSYDNCICCLGNGAIAVSAQAYNDVNSFKTAVNGKKFVYELATLAESQITPVTVNSIEGDNSVYHDANGDITVKYKTTIRCLMNQ